MSDTLKRIVVACILVAIVAIIALLEHFGINATRYAGILLVLAMIVEFGRVLINSETAKTNVGNIVLFFALLILMLFAVNSVGQKPWIMLILVMIIAGADVGAWLFGKMLGGDKMWEKISEHKTWTGQIAGILCGTAMGILFGFIGAGKFLPQLVWIGISVSLLSQYGDLTASFIKRKLGIKDFGTILPGHGGLIDRFDGWIYALPLVWLVMM